jgi:hypothetical protein
MKIMAIDFAKSIFTHTQYFSNKAIWLETLSEQKAV